MVFNTFIYITFLPILYLIFYFSKDKFRWLILLIASFCFYAGLKEITLLFVLSGIIIINYFVGILIDKYESPSSKKAALWIGILANLFPLIFLKYSAFIVENLTLLWGILSIKIILPMPTHWTSIGVSFYTFQAISYLVDVYLEIEKPERHLGYFALYMSFFPKLLQGPIERAESLLPQIHTKYVFDYDNMRTGLVLFCWGLFKKIVVADRLSLFVNIIYDNAHSHSGMALIVATVFYAFQIYTDFSGYTDMALGSAYFFNIKLTQNFKSPYFANSIADFWRRWHISFSRWLLDYLFKPLQMRYRDIKNLASPLALFITFIICGIWHGASWNFIIWGAINGFYMAFSLFTKNIRAKFIHFIKLDKFPTFHKYIQIIITFILICFAWIFFRTNNMSDAIYIITHLFTGILGFFTKLTDFNNLNSNLLLFQTPLQFAIVVFSLGLVELIQFIQYRGGTIKILFEKPTLVRWGVYYFLVLSVIFFGTINLAQFIYSQF